MKKIIINGSFLCRNLTGIERFSIEICKRLDILDINHIFEIYVPKNAKIISKYKNIKTVISKKNCNSFPIWDHIIFSKYVKKHGVSLDFSNLTSLFTPGFVFIHDIYAKLFPKDFITFKDKLRRLYMCMMYYHAIKKGKHIFTVSEFSKNQIKDYYKVYTDKITVIPNGYEHFNDIKEDVSILKKHLNLKENEFYFSLGSLQKRKNLKWIYEYAKKHPEEIFAVSGKAINGMVSDTISSLKNLPNIILLGYISDAQVKKLMKTCKAFIFPSYYEGFGIPPLEALSVGAKIIISDIPCFKEIFGETAYYINPNNTKIDLNYILQNKNVLSSKEILEKYTYDKSAKKLYNTLTQLL